MINKINNENLQSKQTNTQKTQDTDEWIQSSYNIYTIQIIISHYIHRKYVENSDSIIKHTHTHTNIDNPTFE